MQTKKLVEICPTKVLAFLKIITYNNYIDVHQFLIKERIINIFLIQIIRFPNKVKTNQQRFYLLYKKA